MSAIIGGGSPAQVPGWAPRAELDYMDKTCPFTSGVWGAMVQVEQHNPLSGRPERGIMQAQNTTYQRCTRSCKLFVTYPGTKPEEPAKGWCSFELGGNPAARAEHYQAVLAHEGAATAEEEET